ncbi:MAG: type I restriction endonuclease subunit R [Fusobacteriaceae bacterium]
MADIQSEAELEKNFIELLVTGGYERVVIKDAENLKKNFKIQLQKHNEIDFTEGEFNIVLNYLDGGSIFEKSEKLRGGYLLNRENGEIKHISFIDGKNPRRNILQVSNQITMKEKYENRYDVTVLINGLPLVQVELKRRGIELEQAFHQICRYQKHSYTGLFNYIQIFVISNGVNTKYFSNNKDFNFCQTFFWTDINNNRYSQLEEFTGVFLNKVHIVKMITDYIVHNQTGKILMILRPYQFYAVEKIIDRVENERGKNGYIWHTTGSGKTLTSFKASQILSQNPKVDKVVFCVDRKDLDYQTVKEFNAFSKGSVDGAEKTDQLVKQISNNAGDELIVTTIQKLNNAISNDRYLKRMEGSKDKKIVFIFDECHRTQFGETHERIKKFFTNKQFFGFTGTPIFLKNSFNYRTTEDLFGDCLHEYVIKNAIDDENVLGFSVEYYSTFKNKNLLDENGDDKDVDSMKVEGIDTVEVFSAPRRLENIVDFIVANHNRKTYERACQSIFAVSDIKTLNEYYKIFKKKNEALGDKKLKIAAIYTYGANEDLTNDEGTFEIEGDVPLHSREMLDLIVQDYNMDFSSNFDINQSGGFNKYFIDISKNIKEKKIDILLVVNMFLTGFDSKYLNTLYVDKNLKYHGLIQAFSRTNRILDERKKHGNILCFRNLKKRTDEAVALFSKSNQDAMGTVLMKSYEEYTGEFNKLVDEFHKLVPTVDSVDNLESEEEKLEFVQKYRNILRLMNRLSTFTEFNYDDLDMKEQEYLDYNSKYLDLYKSVVKQGGKEKVSILDDLDFEIDLIQRDEINVSYIMTLFKDLDVNSETFLRDKEFIIKLMEGNPELKEKAQLIKQFIDENLPELGEKDDVEHCFHSYLADQRGKEIGMFIQEEDLSREKYLGAISEYEYLGDKDKIDVKSDIFNKQPSVLFINKKIALIKDEIKNIVSKYIW